MTKYSWLAATAVTLCVAGFAGKALTQPSPDNSVPDASVPSDPPPNYLSVSIDDMMTMLIQPRHTKLFYAGRAKNWELAAAETRELRQALNKVAATVPANRGYDIPVLMDRFVFTPLDQMAAAVQAADTKKFNSAYQDITNGCNSCHTYMEHPYDVIQVPSAKAVPYPDQDFRAAK